MGGNFSGGRLARVRVPPPSNFIFRDNDLCRVMTSILCRIVSRVVFAIGDIVLLCFDRENAAFRSLLLFSVHINCFRWLETNKLATITQPWRIHKPKSVHN